MQRDAHSPCPLNVGPALPTAAANLPLVLLALVIILFSYLYSPYAGLSSKLQPEDLSLLQIQPCLIPGFKTLYLNNTKADIPILKTDKGLD